MTEKMTEKQQETFDEKINEIIKYAGQMVVCESYLSRIKMANNIVDAVDTIDDLIYENFVEEY